MQNENDLLIILNLTPVVRRNFRVGVPHPGDWELILNSDDIHYNGSGVAVKKDITAEPTFWMNQNESISLDLPPLSGLVYKRKLKK